MRNLLVLFALSSLLFGCEDKGSSDGETGTAGGDGGGGDGGVYAAGDCQVSVPADAEVVLISGAGVSGYGVFYVCAGASLSNNGGYASIFAEAGASVSNNGAEAEIWGKSGAIIGNNGAGSVITVEPGTDYGSNGAWTTVYECDSITYDASAVGDPC